MVNEKWSSWACVRHQAHQILASFTRRSDCREDPVDFLLARRFDPRPKENTEIDASRPLGACWFRARARRIDRFMRSRRRRRAAQMSVIPVPRHHAAPTTLPRRTRPRPRAIACVASACGRIRQRSVEGIEMTLDRNGPYDRDPSPSPAAPHPTTGFRISAKPRTLLTDAATQTRPRRPDNAQTDLPRLICKPSAR